MNNKYYTMTTRRDFLKRTTLGTAGLFIMPTILSSHLFGKNAPSNRINVAMIGCGRQTVNPNIPQIIKSEIGQVVAVCDIDNFYMYRSWSQIGGNA